jgi:hypothetical protein
MRKPVPLSLNFITTVSAVAIVVLASNANAQSLPVCPLEVAIRNLEDFNEKLNYSSSQETSVILGQMDQINTKAKNPTLPLKSQLPQADLNAFQLLREQLLALEGQEIVESGYLRDGRVISEAAKVAFTLSQGVNISEQDPGFFYYSVVLLMRAQHPADSLKLTIPRNPKECNVEAGLHFNEQLALSVRPGTFRVVRVG